MRHTLSKQQPRIRLERVQPQVDCARYPAKRTVGERVDVSAVLIHDGAAVLGACIHYRGPATRRWSSAPLELVKPLGKDVFAGSFEVTECGWWEFAVEAWSDRFATFRDELRRKVEAGQKDLSGELAEGAELLGIPQLDVETALGSTATDKHGATRSATLTVEVDREVARFGAWYELFPRSFGGFAGVEKVLPQLAELGFDVVYFPPIHPIGRSGRKGANNTLPAKKKDPGSPWAIGAAEGGARRRPPGSRHPCRLRPAGRARAGELGLEIALDFAIQCSPDHPWLREHPEWFQHRPDGTIKYAENPPKKYEDIVNVDWECEDWQGLWEALRDIVLHWIAHGVHIFRVDNPHTKPLPFWEWLIAEVRRDHPNVVFLAEAFTRPAMMRALGKLGFNQSYTYFTWKNTRYELTEYVTELATEMADYYRPNFFANTPDILHEYLQLGGRPAFEARLVLAATLSPSYGIYSGFEACENVPLRLGGEDYLDSEKYELKKRQIAGPLLPLIQRLNEIRRANRSLQHIDNITFLETGNESLIAYAKQSPADTLIVCVNLDPAAASIGLVTVPDTLRAAPLLPGAGSLDR